MSSKKLALIFFFLFLIFFKIGKNSQKELQTLGIDFPLPFFEKNSASFLIKDNFLEPYPLFSPELEKKTENQNSKEKEYFFAIITGYSSSFDETDLSPSVTASGKKVREGICANNLLPFGTKVRFPDIFGEKVFIVEDRMNSLKSPFHFDIWFESKEKALEFGAKISRVEILE